MNNKNKFKVGDRVRISKDSEFYGDSSSNPSYCEGTVTEKYDADYKDFTTEVKWDNGETNSYRDRDLELVANKDKFKKGDRVRISKDSEYYNCPMTTNPSDCAGTVTKYTASKEFTIDVDWDNGEYNNYRDEDLELVSATNTSEPTVLTVDKDFVMQAHKSACSDWKKKIEQKFPELFPSNPYTKLVTDESKLASSTLYYKNSDGEFVSLLYNTALIAGVAGCYKGIPNEAKYRGIYINKHVDVEVVKTDDGTAIIFKDKK